MSELQQSYIDSITNAKSVAFYLYNFLNPKACGDRLFRLKLTLKIDCLLAVAIIYRITIETLILLDYYVD